MHTTLESKANVQAGVFSILSAQVQLDGFQFFIHPGLGTGHTYSGLYTLQICPAKRWAQHAKADTSISISLIRAELARASTNLF